MSMGMAAPGKALKALRQARRLSRKEAARALGVHNNAVGAWERGESHPRLDHFDAYLELLDAPRDLIMDLVRDKTASPLDGLKKMVDYLQNSEKLSAKDIARIDDWRSNYGSKAILDAIAHGPD